jgi:hypothetical protein
MRPFHGARPPVSSPRFDPLTGLCFRHQGLSIAGASGQPSPSDSLDLSAELLPELSASQGRADLRKFLARLLTLVTQGRVTPRRASTSNTRPAPPGLKW